MLLATGVLIQIAAWLAIWRIVEIPFLKWEGFALIAAVTSIAFGFHLMALP